MNFGFSNVSEPALYLPQPCTWPRRYLFVGYSNHVYPSRSFQRTVALLIDFDSVLVFRAIDFNDEWIGPRQVDQEVNSSSSGGIVLPFDRRFDQGI